MPGTPNDPMSDLDLATLLSADAGVSTDQFSIYIPNKDRDGVEFGTQRKWVLDAIRLLADIGGGATALPPSEGAWLNDQTGQLVWENPVVVYTYIKPDRFAASLDRIRSFLIVSVWKRTGRNRVRVSGSVLPHQEA